MLGLECIRASRAAVGVFCLLMSLRHQLTHDYGSGLCAALSSLRRSCPRWVSGSVCLCVMADYSGLGTLVLGQVRI